MLQSLETQNYPHDHNSLFENNFENLDYLQKQIITYLGNKRSLFSFLEPAFNIVKTQLGKEKIVFLDVFSGSGIVSRFARKHASLIIANDLERYSYIINKCYGTNQSNKLQSVLSDLMVELQHSVAQNMNAGFLAELYAPLDDDNIQQNERAFYTHRNAVFLDTARQEIEYIDDELKHFFLAPLLAKASVHSNTSGVFKGFYKNKQGIGQFGGQGKHALSRITSDMKLELPIFSNIKCDVIATQNDANQLMKEIEVVDLAYFDPPYNQHPYGSNYFMLNLLCDYVRPDEVSKVSGIPTNWNRSDYNKPQSVETALFDAVENCPAKFVLISYSSEGFIKHETFLHGLAECGKIKVMDMEYNTFRGCRNLNNRNLYVTEYLYLVDKR